jgi:hypothetical protein
MVFFFVISLMSFLLAVFMKGSNQDVEFYCIAVPSRAIGAVGDTIWFCAPGG